MDGEGNEEFTLPPPTGKFKTSFTVQLDNTAEGKAEKKQYNQKEKEKAEEEAWQQEMSQFEQQTKAKKPGQLHQPPKSKYYLQQAENETGKPEKGTRKQEKNLNDKVILDGLCNLLLVGLLGYPISDRNGKAEMVDLEPNPETEKQNRAGDVNSGNIEEMVDLDPSPATKKQNGAGAWDV